MAMAKDLKELETRVEALEELVGKLHLVEVAGLFSTKKKRSRSKRKYTKEERAAVRERLVAGKEAARIRREAEANGEAEEEFTPETALSDIETGLNAGEADARAEDEAEEESED